MDVCFNRSEEIVGGVGELAEDRLAADHHELALVGYRRRRAKYVLKGGAIHRRR
jgi:hypothetical protein